jgi:hypothetical protein
MTNESININLKLKITKNSDGIYEGVLFPFFVCTFGDTYEEVLMEIFEFANLYLKTCQDVGILKDVLKDCEMDESMLK